MKRRRCPPAIATVCPCPPRVGGGLFLSAPLVGLVGTAAPVIITDPLFEPEVASFGFVEENGILRYVGNVPVRVHVVGNVSISADSESDTLFVLDIAINGVVAPAPAPASGIASLASGVVNITTQRYLLINPGTRLGLALTAGNGFPFVLLSASLDAQE